MQSHLGEDVQTRQKRKNMWKQFGRDTKAGKMLFDLYKSHQPPRINYPKPKPKSQIQKQRQKERLLKLPPPQTTQINYPKPVHKQIPKNEIDFIPHKKNYQAIIQQYKKYKREYQLPAYRPSNRDKDKRDLQSKFKEGRGALPKGAQLPTAKLQKSQQQQIRKNMIAKMQKKWKKGTNEQEKNKRSKIQQLNYLFDQICLQIQQRQKYLQQLQHLDQAQIKQRIKKQMIERVAQLQKITQLRTKQKLKQNTIQQ